RKNSDDRCGRNQFTFLGLKFLLAITFSRKSTPRGTICSLSRRVSCFIEKTLCVSHSEVFSSLYPISSLPSFTAPEYIQVSSWPAKEVISIHSMRNERPSGLGLFS